MATTFGSHQLFMEIVGVSEWISDVGSATARGQKWTKNRFISHPQRYKRANGLLIPGETIDTIVPTIVENRGSHPWN